MAQEEQPLCPLHSRWGAAPTPIMQMMPRQW